MKPNPMLFPMARAPAGIRMVYAIWPAADQRADSTDRRGRCYSVDMRLARGNTGPVAIHIDGFEQYQLNEAWVWEHMALLKARPIGGLGTKRLRKKYRDHQSRCQKTAQNPLFLARLLKCGNG